MSLAVEMTDTVELLTGWLISSSECFILGFSVFAVFAAMASLVDFTMEPVQPTSGFGWAVAAFKNFVVALLRLQQEQHSQNE